jgi:hypothetical protein
MKARGAAAPRGIRAAWGRGRRRGWAWGVTSDGSVRKCRHVERDCRGAPVSGDTSAPGWRWRAAAARAHPGRAETDKPARHPAKAANSPRWAPEAVLPRPRRVLVAAPERPVANVSIKGGQVSCGRAQAARIKRHYVRFDGAAGRLGKPADGRGLRSHAFASWWRPASCATMLPWRIRHGSQVPAAQRNVYLETLVISDLAARPTANLIGAARQASSWAWWERRDRFAVFASALVWQECEQGDPEAASRRTAMLAGVPVLGITAADIALAKELLGRGAFPAKASDDALHLAIAARNRVELLATWNFRHLANPLIRREVSRRIEGLGFDAPVICTPEELLEGGRRDG